MLRGGGKAVVQLQPGRAGTLVPQGVAVKACGEKRHPSAFPHGGQPQPVPGDPGDVPEPLHGGIQKTLYRRGVDRRRRSDLRYVRPGGPHLHGPDPPPGPALPGRPAYRLRLRHGQSVCPAGPLRRRGDGLGGQRVPLGQPGAVFAENRPGVRGRVPGIPRGGPPVFLPRRGGPVGGQLH